MKNENGTTNRNTSSNRTPNGISRTERRRQQLTAYKNAAALIIIIVCGIFSGYVEGHAAPAPKAISSSAKAGRKSSNGNRTKRGTTAARKASQKPRKDDKAIVREYIRTTYGDRYKARIAPAEKTPDRIITSRAGKRTVFVDMFVTKADGPSAGHVITAGPFKGNRIRYAHKAKRGDVVKVYYIYNPHTNADDDIAAIISGGQIRK